MPGAPLRAVPLRLALVCLIAALAATAGVELALQRSPAQPASSQRELGLTATAHGGARATNGRLGLSARFSAHGAVALRTATGARLGLGAPALTRPGTTARDGLLGAPRVSGEKVSFAAAGLREWFANRGGGLEQSLTIARRPGGHGELLITQPFSAATGRVEPGGETALFSSAGGTIRYSALRVTDASGRLLPAALRISGGRLTIAINDSGARYPLRVDPTLAPDFSFAFENSTIDATGSDSASIVVTGSGADGGAPTGTVTVYECAGQATCSSSGTQVASLASYATSGYVSTWTLPAQSAPSPEQYCFYAYYSGDSNYNAEGQVGCFTADDAPTVTSVTPVGQGAQDATLTLDGSDFESTADGFASDPTVTFANSAITVDNVSVVNSGELHVEVSVASGATTGTSDVTVTNPDGSSATGTNAASVDPAPAITATSPDTASAGAIDLNVSVDGSDFASGAGVTFSNAAISVNSVTFVNAGELTANVSIAANATVGASDVTVTNPDGGTGTAGGAFDVQHAVLTVFVAGHQTYGGAGKSIAVVGYSGFVAGQNSSVVNGSLTGCVTSVAAGAGAGVYYGTLSGCSGLSANGYTIAYSDSGFTVNPAPLTITASSPTMTYGGSAPAITPGYSGLENGDTAPATAPTCSSAASSTTPAGSYASSCTGAADPNYTITYDSGSVTVSPATLTITASSPTTTYGTVPTITPRYSGFVAGDGPGSLADLPLCTSTDTANTSTTATAPSSSCSGASDPSYAISYVNGSVTITPASLRITASSPTITYGAAVPTVTASYSGFVAGDGPSALSGTLSCSVNGSTPLQAGGSYTTGCSGLTSANYTISYVAGAVKVNPAALTITASSATVTYGGVAPTITPIYAGLENGDSAPATAPGCSSPVDSSTPAGSYTSSCSGAADPNYTISYLHGSVTVKPAALTITASSPTMTYGGSVPAITAGYSGFIPGDGTASLTTLPECYTTATSSSAVASAPATICYGASDPNYTITYTKGAVTVDRAPLTITAASTSMTYGSTPPAVTPNYSGFVNNDNASDLTTQPTCSTTASSATPAGTLSSANSCSGASAANYTIEYLNGSVTVNPAPLTVYVTGSQSYGGTPSYAIAGYSGFEHGDGSSVLSGTLTCSTTVTSTTVPGTYYFMIDNCGGLSAANYTVGYGDDGFTVAPATLTITASSPTMSYGGAAPTVSASYSGFLPGQNATSLSAQPTCYTTATSSSAVGSSPVTACNGADDPNYRIVYVDGSVTVNPVALQITASSPTMTYGGAVPAITPSYSGFVNNDNASDLTTQPTCSTTATSSSAAGSAQTTSCTGASDANYTISYSGGTTTIEQAALTVEVSGSETYGGTPSFHIAGYSGFAAGDSSSSLSGSLGGCATSAGAAAGSFSGTISGCGGLSDPNYAISYADDGFTVNPAALQITASSATMTYGAAAPAVTASYSGLVHGDSPSSLTIGPSCTTTATSSSPAGSAQTTSCAGAYDPNYEISYVAGSVTVHQAALEITASSPTMTYGGAVPAITPSYSGFVNNDSASSLTTQPTCSTTATSSSAAGSAQSSSCTGAADPNYAISYTPGSVSVNRAPLTARITGSQTYGGTGIAYTVESFAGFVNGDTQTSGAVSGAPSCSTSVAANAPAGGYPLTISDCSGLTAANYTISYSYGPFTVLPAPLVITATPGSATMTYGSAPPTISASYNGFVSPDDASSLSTQPTCSTTASATSSAGTSLPAICEDAADPNYSITYVNGSVTVDPAPLQITASSATIVYGGAVPAITPSYSGFVDNDQPDNLTAQATCTTPATSASAVAGSPYGTSCSGAADSNYSISYVPGTVTVERAPLTITVTGHQVYGGSPSFEVSGYGGFVNGENQSVLSGGLDDCTTTATGSTPAGVYQGTIAHCAGLAGANYSISYADGGFTVTDAHTTSVSALPLTSIELGEGESDSAVVTGNSVGGAPTGTVTFYECGVQILGVIPCASGGTQVGAAVVLHSSSADSSKASSSIFDPDSGPGTYCFRAVYSGDNNYDGSADGTSDECFSVSQAGAPMHAAPSATSLGIGQSVTDSVTVSGNAVVGPPTGTVTFYACNPGSTPCSSGGSQVGATGVQLTPGSGNTATATSEAFTPADGTGTYCFRAVYAGDPDYTGSSDGTGDQCVTVAKGASATASAPAYATIQAGESDNDTVTVTGSAAGGAPTGTVSFYLCGPGAGSCASSATPIGSAVTLAAGTGDSSSASSAYATPTAPGSYCFYAVYSGSENYLGSSDATSQGCFTLAAASTPSTASTVTPSNAFTVAGHSYKAGQIHVTLELPGAGSLELLASHSGTLARRTVSVNAAGRTTVTLTLSKHAKASLAGAVAAHKAFRAKLTLTFTPAGGSPRTETLTLTL
jgi:hypothetical protein